MTLKKLENESILDWKYRVLVDKSKGELEEGWKEIAEELNIGLAHDTIRKGTIFLPEFEEYMINKYNKNTDLPTYKEVKEIKADGTHTSDKLIRISDDDMKNSDSLLEAHGFDKNEWELTSAKNSIWNSGIDNTLYSSRISVKPKVNGFDIEKFLKLMKKNIEKSQLSTVEDKKGENMLVIPYFDLHFGIGNLEIYQNLLNKTLNKIKSKKWDKVLVIFGQDALHNDGFTSQTTSGTIIDRVDMEKAWSDLHVFYTNIFDCAIKNSNSVDGIFSNGNHDQSMGWAFGKLLEYQYPQVKFDSEMKQFKGYSWKNIFIGATHGDRGANRIFEVFLAEYGKLIATATTKEILSGHIHHQKTIDKYGLVHKTLGSGVPTDGYHANNGFVGAQKQFQLLEYNENYPEAIYYM